MKLRARKNTISQPPAEDVAVKTAAPSDISVSERALFFALPYAFLSASYVVTKFTSPETFLILEQLVHLYVMLVNDVFFNKVMHGAADESTVKHFMDSIKAFNNLTYLSAMWVIGVSCVVAVWYPIPRTKGAWAAFGCITCTIFLGLMSAYAFFSTWIEVVGKIK